MDPLRLEPMSEADFTALLSHLETDYSSAQVAAGNWDPATARERFAEQMEQLLPHGVATEGHHLFIAHDAETRVGHVWLGPRNPGGADELWIYDIEVADGLRGRGYGRRLLAAAEAEAARLGARRIGLNVFGDNVVARALYESSGYALMAQQMRKDLTAS